MKQIEYHNLYLYCKIIQVLLSKQNRRLILTRDTRKIPFEKTELAQNKKSKIEIWN